MVCPKTNSTYDLHLSGCIYVGWPTPTRGAAVPLFFAFVPETNFVLDTIFFVAAFQNLAWCPAPGPTPGNAKLTQKIAKELNAQDRKKLQKKIKLERKRSQKLGQKKGANAPLIFQK